MQPNTPCPGSPVSGSRWHLRQQRVPERPDVLLPDHLPHRHRDLHLLPPAGETEHRHLLGLAQDGAGKAHLGAGILLAGPTATGRGGHRKPTEKGSRSR